jgi:WD40 repeat protein
LLSNLLSYAALHKTVDQAYSESLRGALDEGGRNEAADGIVQTFDANRDLLRTFLRQQHPEDVPLAPAHQWLRRIPFSAVVTTNYDRLLERALPEYESEGLFTPQDAKLLLDALAQKRRFILKLYGRIERAETLIFAPFEYRQQLATNILFSRFIEGIFFSRTFLFLGLSLEGIQDFLSGFVFRGVSPRKHVALVAVIGSAWKVKAELLQRRYNIEVLPYPISDEYPEVDQFLEELSVGVRVSSGQPQPASFPGVRRVTLEDIGPYEHLDLRFPPGYCWKVLLGDNGVGKSTILKAIAVAIVGSDAKSFAARLVRTGKTKGRITLYTEQNPTAGYVTEILTKDMASEAEVVSLPTRPMEAEGWLALGFSALRVVTWAASAGPQPIVERGRPAAEDLLPLITGESDPRMDRLKQWIVNLDSADSAKPQTLSGHQERLTTVLFSNDGGTLISASIDRTIRFWDLARNAQNRTVNAHAAGVNAIAMSRNGAVLASGSYDKVAKTWDTTTGALTATFAGSRTQILSVALDASGTTLVTASESGSIRVWDRTGRELARYSVGDRVWTIAFSNDDRTLAAGTYGGAIALLDPTTGELIAELPIKRGVIMSVAWAPDNQWLAAASRNGPVSVWNVAERRLVRELPGTDSMAVAVSPDGRAIAAGFGNGEIKAWDVGSGEALMQVQAHPQPVRSLAFSPDGRTLASGSEDATIKLWSLPDSIHGGKQQETIRRFFRLIGSLTDRPDIHYLEVTSDYRVLVKTANAPEPVPLEALSQGMTSLFGWVGVLCQRLKETLQIPTQDPLPTRSYALVLIDELDAHMHPRWQQVVVERLKRVFPNVQFIASTHSPLIVGGLDPEEVDRFEIREGSVVKIELEPDMTLGRADQILTSDLFGLPSTFDSMTQALMQEYEVLLGRSQRTDEEKDRFAELERVLEQRIPAVPEKPVERRARELLDTLQSTLSLQGTDVIQERMTRLAKALRGRDE